MFPANAQRSARAARLLLIDRDAATGHLLDQCWDDGDRPLLAKVDGGREALDLLRGGRFDIIFADLDSILDLAALTDAAMGRLVKISADSLIIALSDARSVSAAVAAMRAGAHDYLTKPLDRDTLLARIGTLGLRHGKELAVSAGHVSAETFAAIQTPPAPAYGEIVAKAEKLLPMWRQEQRIIEEAVMSFAGNIALAAAALELSPSTIYRKRQAWSEMEGRKGAA